MKNRIPEAIMEELFELEEESELADAFLNECYFAFDDAALKAIGKSIAGGLNAPQAYRKAVLPTLDDDGKEAYAAIQVGFGLDSIRELDRTVYEQNPYYVKVMKALQGKKTFKNWTLECQRYRAYEPFVYDEVVPSEASPLVMVSPVGYFPSEFPYPALRQGERTYMSLIPHEINTMVAPIARAKGRVLAMGLGMGYFAFMASQKDEVTSVTVLERDEGAIALFKECFLPLFDHPEKIRIVKTDALEFETEEPYDYLFADLHHDAEDGLPLYLSLMKKAGLAKETDVWIEKAILSYFARHLIALLEEEYSGYDDSNYANPTTFSERVLAALHFHLKNYELATEEDLGRLLSFPFLAKLATELRLK